MTPIGVGTYLRALQNNAEMRDQGMVLSCSVTRFRGGALEFELRPVRPET